MGKEDCLEAMKQPQENTKDTNKPKQTSRGVTKWFKKQSENISVAFTKSFGINCM